MALDIVALKAAFANKSAAGGEGQGNTGFWDMFYPFYKMDFDTVSTFRFLPDQDSENPLGFIVENKYHELTINGKKKRVACLKMYGEDSCPCCDKSAEYYNAGDQAMGKLFWRKIDYIASGLVINTPFDYPIKDDENPVRLVSMSKQLYEKLENEIVKGDLDEMPYDMQNGYDFRILKNKKIVPDGKGGTREFGNYADSGFARKASAIPDHLLARLELVDVKKYRFAKIEREQMELMLQSALTGASYSESTPAADSTGNTRLDAAMQHSEPVQSGAAVVAAAQSDAPTSAAPAAKLSPAEILARVKARNAGQS